MVKYPDIDELIELEKIIENLYGLKFIRSIVMVETTEVKVKFFYNYEGHMREVVFDADMVNDFPSVVMYDIGNDLKSLKRIIGGSNGSLV